MNKFDEIALKEMQIGYEGGKYFASGTVSFSASSGDSPEVSVKVSVYVELPDSIQALRIALIEEATFLLREVSALPDDTIVERLHLGSRSYNERVALVTGA